MRAEHRSLAAGSPVREDRSSAHVVYRVRVKWLLKPCISVDLQPTARIACVVQMRGNHDEHMCANVCVCVSISPTEAVPRSP